MSFFVKKNKFSYTLIVSLKSSSINLQLLKEGGDIKKEIEFVSQNTILLENSQDPVLYMAEYTKELTHIFNINNSKIKQIAGDNPLQIYFLLYAPWFTSKIDVTLHKEEILLNQEFVEREIKNIDTQNNLKVLERQIIKLKTNGYTITEIKDIKCSNVEVYTYSSFISLKVYEMLHEITQKYFSSTKNIKFCSSPLMSLEHIKRFMIKEDNIIFLTIGAEITEVGIIEDDALVNFSTFPIGIHDFLRSIQASAKTYDYDLLYQKQLLLKSDAQKNDFEQMKKNWTYSFIQTLNSFKEHTPHKIVLITDLKVKEFFSVLMNETIKSDTENLKNYRIINFDISTLKDIITYKTPVGEEELILKLEALI
jgi:hypothetical protein